jgi:hypothetical protein
MNPAPFAARENHQNMNTKTTGVGRREKQNQTTKGCGKQSHEENARQML